MVTLAHDLRPVVAHQFRPRRPKDTSPSSQLFHRARTRLRLSEPIACPATPITSGVKPILSLPKLKADYAEFLPDGSAVEGRQTRRLFNVNLACRQRTTSRQLSTMPH